MLRSPPCARRWTMYFLNRPCDGFQTGMDRFLIRAPFPRREPVSVTTGLPLNETPESQQRHRPHGPDAAVRLACRNPVRDLKRGMGGRGVIGRAAYSMALLAVALFSLASVRSIEMQAASASLSIPMCGSMAESHTAHTDPAPQQKKHARCEFCAAAAHAPVCTAPPEVRPSSTIAWAAYSLVRNLGRREPAQITPKSRGPPGRSVNV
jgi:hypothetical protein